MRLSRSQLSYRHVPAVVCEMYSYGRTCAAARPEKGIKTYAVIFDKCYIIFIICRFVKTKYREMGRYYDESGAKPKEEVFNLRGCYQESGTEAKV